MHARTCQATMLSLPASCALAALLTQAFSPGSLADPQGCPAGERELATGPSSQADAAEAACSSEDEALGFRDLSHIDPEFESDFAALLAESRGRAGGASAGQRPAEEPGPEARQEASNQAGLDRMAFNVLLKRSGRDDRTHTIEVHVPEHLHALRSIAPGAAAEVSCACVCLPDM